MKRRIRGHLDVRQLARFERRPTDSIRDVVDAKNLKIGP